MECQDCVDSVSNVLSSIPGINDYKVSLEDQSVLVNGTVAPSKITTALRETGRAAILRGSGESGDGLGSLSKYQERILTCRCRSMYSRLQSTRQSPSRCSRISENSSTAFQPTSNVCRDYNGFLPGGNL